MKHESVFKLYVTVLVGEQRIIRMNKAGWDSAGADDEVGRLVGGWACESRTSGWPVKPSKRDFAWPIFLDASDPDTNAWTAAHLSSFRQNSF